MSPYKAIKILIHVSELDLGAKVEDMVNLLTYLRSNVHKVSGIGEADDEIGEHQITFVPTRHETDIVITPGNNSFETDYEYEEFSDSLEEVRNDLLHYVDETIASECWCSNQSQDFSKIVKTVCENRTLPPANPDDDNYLDFLGNKVEFQDNLDKTSSSDANEDVDVTTPKIEILIDVETENTAIPEVIHIQPDVNSCIKNMKDSENTTIKDVSSQSLDASSTQACISEQKSVNTDTEQSPLVKRDDVPTAKEEVNQQYMFNPSDCMIFKKASNYIFFFYSLNMALKLNTKKSELFIISDIKDVFGGDNFKSLITKAKRKMPLGKEVDIMTIDQAIISKIQSEVYSEINDKRVVHDN